MARARAQTSRWGQCGKISLGSKRGRVARRVVHLVEAPTAEMAGVSEDTAEVSADQMEDPGSGQAGDLAADQMAVVHLGRVVRVLAGRDRRRRHRLTQTPSCW